MQPKTLAKQILSNKAVNFLLLKYVAFGIQLLNSVLIAKFLGIYYYGLYGFVLLVGQYLSYSNFGVQYSYSVLSSDVSTKQGDQRLQITGTSISLLLCISFFLFVIHFFTQSLNLFPKYRFTDYDIYVVLIAVFQYFNILFVNIFRVNGKTFALNVYYLIVPFAQLVPLFFFTNESLFFALLYATIIGNILALSLFLVQLPNNIRKAPFFQFKLVGTIIKRGVFLLLYNFAFYGILLTARTIVSNTFNVEEFALFNFALNIANAVFLLLGSLNFLFYPKLINVISSKDNKEKLIVFIERIRMYYLTLTILVVFVSLLSFPILFYYLPQYAGAAICLGILLLAQLVINNSFGYSTLLVQKGKELQMTICASISIIVIICGSLVGLNYYNNMVTVAISVFIGVLVYNLLIGYLANKILNQFEDVISFFIGMFSPSLFIPVICCVILMFISPFYFINIVFVIILYGFFNLSQLKIIFKGGINLLTKRDILSIE